MVDAGEDWRGRIGEIRPNAIVLTHAHPDHADGLQDGVDCPAYATKDTWDVIDEFRIGERHVLRESETAGVCGIEFTAVGVEHSIRCPAVGYRICAGAVTIFYAPDVVYITDRDEALNGVRLYIGDGATMQGQMVRRRGEHLIGHAPVRTQLTWCEKAGVPEAIITHCGSEIVTGDERKLNAQLRRWADERGVHAQFAHDGMRRVLR